MYLSNRYIITIFGIYNMKKHTEYSYKDQYQAIHLMS